MNPRETHGQGGKVGGDPRISFVIPAFNEAIFISKTLASIDAALKGRYAYETIVVDNGSTDGTPDLAREAGSQVLIRTHGTIGSLRNLGAARATGEILVFLDADVTLSEEWPAHLEDVLAILGTSPNVLSGSACAVPSQSTWLERVWFGPHVADTSIHLGSAHMIIRRDYFLTVGGFDESLATGEDCEFSYRVLRDGTIHRLPLSAVQHHGYPKTLSQFFKREAWHGTGDCTSVKAVLSSKIATATLIFLCLHVVLLVSLIGGFGAVAAAAAVGIVLLCLAASFRRYRKSLGLFLANAALYYVYFAGRSTSFIPGANRRPARPAAGNESPFATVA